MKTMVSEKKRKEYKLLQQDIDYVDKVAKEQRIQPSEAISKIILQHKEPELEKTLKQILSGINKVINLCEVQLEVINSICLKENYQIKDFISRNEFISDFISKAYEEVEKSVASKNIVRSNRPNKFNHRRLRSNK
jgi:hypothetical protein